MLFVVLQVTVMVGDHTVMVGDHTVMVLVSIFQYHFNSVLCTTNA